MPAARPDAIAGLHALRKDVAALQMSGVGVMFATGSKHDFKNSTRVDERFDAEVRERKAGRVRQQDRLSRQVARLLGARSLEGVVRGAEGNLQDWWTGVNTRAFTQRSTLVSQQFDSYVVLNSLHVNGKLTLGEDIADLGGRKIAYEALERSISGKRAPLIDGFTPEQRFCLLWAQVWRGKMRPDAERQQVLTDPHAPSHWRTDGPLANMPEFAAAFGCKSGDAMVRPDSLRPQIW